MKKLILTAIFALATLSISAQSTFTNDENSVTLNVVGVDLTFITGSRGNRMVVTSPRNARYRTHISLIEIGFNTPTQTTYGAYPTDAPKWFDIWAAKSTQVTFNILNTGIRLTPTGVVGLATAIGLSWNDYVFNEPTLVTKTDGLLTAAPINSDKWIKSKIHTFAIRVPLLLEFGRHKSFFGSVGVYGDVVLGSRSKVKYGKKNKEIHRNMYAALPQAGVTARFGYKRIYVFGNYSLTHLFTKNRGPQTNLVTLGFGIGL